jgi:hypothetical protein
MPFLFRDAASLAAVISFIAVAGLWSDALRSLI